MFRTKKTAGLIVLLLCLVLPLSLFGCQMSADKPSVLDKKEGLILDEMEDLTLDEDECLSQVELTSFLWGGTGESDIKIRRSAQEMAAGMTDAEKVGQLFLLKYTGRADAEGAIQDYQLGGFIMMGDAFAERTPDDVKADIRAIQEMSDIPLIISTDEEGGHIARVSGIGGTAYRQERFLSPRQILDMYPDNMEQALSYVTAQGNDMAGLLLGLGINMNHAPVGDMVTTGRQRTAFGGYGKPQFDDAYMGYDGKDAYNARTWGGTALETGAYVEAAVNGMEGNGLGTTIKHFPGYGNSITNGHDGVVIYSEKEYQRAELYEMMIPFIKGIKAGSSGMMITHNVYECFDPDDSMSMSPALYDFIRNEMGFDGLCVTDGLDMDGIMIGGQTKAEAALSEADTSVAAISAGVDMCIVTDTSSIDAAIKRMRLDEDFAKRVDESCMRVLSWKMAHGILDYDE